MEFTISNHRKYRYLYKPLLIGLAADFVIVYLGIWYYNANLSVALQVILAVLIGQSILIYIPLVLFYWNYLKTNKNSVLKIDPYVKTFTFTDGGKTIISAKANILKVTFHMSIPAYHGRTIYLWWHDFFYAKIQTTKGDFIVTCLLCDKLEDYVPEDKIEKKSSHFAHAFPK